MQNRLAQREFRARRLEHIKELEARVDFLSRPQSEQTEILVAIIGGEFLFISVPLRAGFTVS